MDCLACTAANPDGNRFCQNCGASLSPKCGQCGFECAPGARFCGGCGASLNRELAASVGALAQQPPVAAGLGWGELKQATVLFADIVSSTEKIARLDPEEAMERLKPAVQTMCDAVERFGGTVIRTLGDGVMALFGVPQALEGHGRLACQAALHMQSAFDGHAGGLSIRVGLHSGLVASDPYAPDVGRGGGAHGMTIHLASRVIGLAEPGGICITDTCRALLGAGCDVEPLGEHMLKGIARPTPIFRLTGLRAITASVAGERAWATHFRGREYEFELLKNSLRQTEYGHARVVGIAGEPGSGKSRLCHEFGKWCREQGIPVCEVGVQLYGHATPLQPILELLRKFYFGVGESDGPEAARSDIAAMLRKLDGTDEEIALVCELLGVAEPGTAPSALSPRAKHRQLLNVFWRLVRSDAESSAVILVEDLHWLDDASEEFIATLVEAVAGTRTFVVLNYRPSYQPLWAKSGHFVQMHLPDLSRADMDVLVAELVGHTPQLAEVRRMIAARSGGNPFFAEELSRSLLDSGLLQPGGDKLDLAAIEGAMPVTVQAVIAARIDSLGEPEKTLLQMCAIIGKDIPLAVLENVASPLAAVIDRGLAGLCRAGLIVQQSLGGRRHFTFRHPLIQEVAYGAQLRVRRQVLHAAVAQSMEAYYRQQPDEYAGLIAYHYEAAKRPVDAATHMARAARWVGATDPSRAIKLWYRVRRLLETEPNSRAVDSLRALAGGRIVYLGWREGLGLDEVDAIMQDALARASEADTRLIQLLLFAHGRILQSSGGAADGFVASLRKALALGDASDQGRCATLNLALSHAYAWAGLLEEGLAANDVALASLDKIDSFDREFIGFSVEEWAYAIRVRLLNRMGRFGESQEYLWKMSQLSDASGDPLLRQIAHHAVVDLAWCKGEARLALHHSQEVLAIAQENDTPYARIFAGYGLGLAELTAGRPVEARSHFDTALALVRAQKVAVDFEAELLAGLSECELQLQALDAAVAGAREAAAVSHARSNRVAELRAQVVLAAALAQSDAESMAAGQAALARAEVLLAETGAAAFAGRIAAARAAFNLAA